MGPVKAETTNTKQNWNKINRAKKEERKKWKEQNLIKKAEKQKNKTKSLEGAKPLELKPYSTISIAVPGSVLENAQSQELRTYLAGQVARAVCIFQADEVIVFDDYCDEANAKKAKFDDESGNEKLARTSCVQLGRILQYLECPQYLRKGFFPIHDHLKYCGLLNPLNAPHHLDRNDNFAFREGIVQDTPVKPGKGSLVNVGLLQFARIDKLLKPGFRCTVKLLPQEPNSKKLKGVVVSPSTPRTETGIYWGYRVRIANSLSKVFSQCPYKDGYDLTMGTSDKGNSIDDFICPKYRHLLIMFGGVKGLESALENDDALDADDPRLLFNYYLNTLPNQGSRTLRTEEAILISLAGLRPKLNPEYKVPEFDEKNLDFHRICAETVKEEEIVQTEPIDDMSRFD